MVDSRTVTVKLTVAPAPPPDAALRPRAKVNSSAQRRPANPRPPPRSTPTSPHTRTRSDARRPHYADTDGRLSPSPPVRIKSKVTANSLPRQSTSCFRRPAHSPPASTVSFSTVSSDSVNEHDNDDNDDDDATTTTAAITTAAATTASTTTATTPNLRAAAKSNRKIADLEITNRSLLAINASLESTKHIQSKEIRDLRRKLRESRLILPPRAFRAVNATDDLALSCSDDDDNIEQDDSKDEVYVRIKAMLDNLLDTGRRALESTPQDFVQRPKGGAKVLSPDELRSWSAADDDGDQDTNEQVPPVPNTELDSEVEVERALVHSYTPSPPPIRISVSKPKR